MRHAAETFHLIQWLSGIDLIHTCLAAYCEQGEEPLLQFGMPFFFPPFLLAIPLESLKTCGLSASSISTQDICKIYCAMLIVWKLIYFYLFFMNSEMFVQQKIIH